MSGKDTQLLRRFCILDVQENCVVLAAQVLERANNTEYGLAAGVWTNNVQWMNALTRYGPAGCSDLPPQRALAALLQLSPCKLHASPAADACTCSDCDCFVVRAAGACVLARFGPTPTTSSMQVMGRPAAFPQRLWAVDKQSVPGICAGVKESVHAVDLESMLLQTCLVHQQE